MLTNIGLILLIISSVFALEFIHNGIQCNQGMEVCTVSKVFTLDKQKALPNPFKGFVPYASTPISQLQAFPASMQNSYFPMSDLMTGPNSFNFSSIETMLNLVKSRNNQAIIRVFSDYPNYFTKKNAYIPDYLIGSVALCNYTNYNGGRSPDYQNPLLINAMLSLISELAKRYDGDNRIAVLQAGLLGHWGEHHTEPPCKYASPATQTTIFTALTNSFKKTKLMVRYPDTIGNIKTQNLGMGYHDDSFAQDTLTDYDWFFYKRMIRANATQQWKKYPIGGQVRPELWTCIFGANITAECANATKADPSIIPEDLNLCIETVHASWQWNQGLFQDAKYMSRDYLDRALYAAANMGYSIQVLDSNFTRYQIGDEWYLNVTVNIQNQGVAPFYYDLTVDLIVDDSTYKMQSNTNLAELLPGQKAQLVCTQIKTAPILLKSVIKMVSQDTYLPIKWAVSQVKANGELSLI